MHQNLDDFYLIIRSLKSNLETQKRLLEPFMDTESMDDGDKYINDHQKIQGECKVYESIHQSILSRHQRVLEFPLQIFQHQTTGYKNLLSTLQYFRTAFTQEINFNEGFITDLTTIVENLAEEHYKQKSVEGDELIQDEWDVLDPLDEDEWDVLDEDEWNKLGELGDLGDSCESDEPSESEESSEESETRVKKLVETFTLGQRGYIKLYF